MDTGRQLDGIYIIRTSEPVEAMSSEDAVRNYKRLTQVERVFRSMKGLDLLVNPIFLSREDRVNAHIFSACLLIILNGISVMLLLHSYLLTRQAKLPETCAPRALAEA